MISKLYNFWQILKGSLWFVPALFCVIYFIATLGLYNLEEAYLQDLELPGIFFSGSNDDAKAMSLALLSSMITMTTLAISITMVVLSLAATQLGPRLIRTFMSDRKTQDFIGLFFGSVIACFLITLILHDAGAEMKTPRLTLSAVFAVCFANLFVLLAFVHHVAQSSIADQVILRVTNDLVTSLDRLSVRDDSEVRRYDKADVSWPKDFDRKRYRLYFNRCGYVQHINYDHIVKIAEEHGLYIEIHFKAGHFLVEGEDGVRIYAAQKTKEFCAEREQEVRDCFIIGNSRTPTQDVEYSIRHLVEIGLRAQSPGMDDNFTAITVLDHLSSAMAVLFKKEVPKEWLADDQDKIRVWAKQSDEADMIFSAFDQMRYSARDKPDIIFHILKKIEILCDLAKTECQLLGLKRQLKEIEFDLKYLDDLVLDIEKLKERCTRLLSRVDEKIGA